MERNITGLISESEKELAEYCMESALGHGAAQVRISLSKSILDSVGMLNGEVDKVAHSADRSVFLYVFADGRYGTFSTNRLDKAELARFAANAVDTVKMLAEDPFRQLPDPARTEKGAVTGRELGLYDSSYEYMTAGKRMEIARDECISGKTGDGKDYRIISEECEYSDSTDDNLVLDSSGFYGRHTETSFAVCSEITIEDKGGRKYSGYWWDSSPFIDGLDRMACSEAALDRAIRQMNPRNRKGGKYRMVVDASVSSRLVSPVISALNATSIQQESSFLKDSLGKRIFGDGLSIIDCARTPGKPGARLFDTEGVATRDCEVIRGGAVKMYFTNTYIARKMGMEPTVEGVSRPVLVPFSCKKGCGEDSGVQFNAGRIMKECGSGIYVTGFNGGNCNQTTGDFSYGIEGFAFRDGQILHPVREMVITGNMVGLWNSLLFAGNDARPCTRWQIPSLCFDEVDFSS